MTSTHTISATAADNAALYAAIGHLAFDTVVHEVLGTAVTTREGDVWFLDNKGGPATSFVSARPMRNGSWHVRYAYGPGRAAVIDKALKAAKAAGATKVWTNERGNDAVLPVAGFKAAAGKPGFIRWEKEI